MRILALVSGFAGAIAGFIGGLVVILVGGVSGLFAAEGSAIVILLGLIAMAASTVGMAGAFLAIPRARLAAYLMVGAALVGVLAASVAFVPAALLLGAGAALAYIGSRSPTLVYLRRHENERPWQEP